MGNEIAPDFFKDRLFLVFFYLLEPLPQPQNEPPGFISVEQRAESPNAGFGIES